MREVYTEQDGALITYSKMPIAPIGGSAQDLLRQLQSFRQAFDLPILSIAELEAVLSQQEQPVSKPAGPRISLEQLKAEVGLEPDGVQADPSGVAQ